MLVPGCWKRRPASLSRLRRARAADARLGACASSHTLKSAGCFGFRSFFTLSPCYGEFSSSSGGSGSMGPRSLASSWNRSSLPVLVDKLIELLPIDFRPLEPGLVGFFGDFELGGDDPVGRLFDFVKEGLEVFGREVIDFAIAILRSSC
jgi:hypothetical protein